MDLQYWIWIAVGLSFSLYIGIAIWSRAGSTKEFYVAGEGFTPLPMGWQLQPTGCRQLRLSLWQESSPLLAMMGQCTSWAGLEVMYY